MVKIADVLEQRSFESSPCVAHISQTEPTRVLSYQDAWKSLKEHEIWLKDVLRLPSEPSSSTGDVVLAYLSSNSTDMMISVLAAASSIPGVVVALLNTRWTPSEMATVLQTPSSSSSRTMLLYSSEFQDKALETQSILRHTTQLVELPPLSNAYLQRYESTGTRKISISASDEEIDAQIQTCAGNSDDDDALLVFTSGTTSGSKGVRLSHRSLWIQALAKLRKPCRYSSTTNMLSNTVPLFHVGGLSSTLALWLAGGTWMVPTSAAKGFDPATVLKLAAHSVFPTNTLVVVPAMLHALLQQASGSSSYPAVELILIGGQSASDDMLTTLRQVFPNARLVQTYACTEAASSMTFHEPSFADDDQPLPIAGDCVGQPPPHVKLQLVHRAEGTGQVTIVNEPYQVGILATSGPHVMNGYWKRGSQSPPSKRKWFLTNDLGFRCGVGRYYFCGRGKDVIRTGGETVIALEVERVLLHHSGIISECAVFALPDDRFGEAVCVAIVMKAHTPPPLSLQDIRNRYCQSLAGYKRPRRLFFVDTLPRNSSGKVLKYKLVQQFTAPTTSKL